MLRAHVRRLVVVVHHASVVLAAIILQPIGLQSRADFFRLDCRELAPTHVFLRIALELLHALEFDL